STDSRPDRSRSGAMRRRRARPVKGKAPPAPQCWGERASRYRAEGAFLWLVAVPGRTLPPALGGRGGLSLVAHLASLPPQRVAQQHQQRFAHGARNLHLAGAFLQVVAQDERDLVNDGLEGTQAQQDLSHAAEAALLDEALLVEVEGVAQHGDAVGA